LKVLGDVREICGREYAGCLHIPEYPGIPGKSRVSETEPDENPGNPEIRLIIPEENSKFSEHV